MKVSVRVSLFALLYLILAFASWVTDKEILGYTLFLAAVITLAGSAVCEAVEKK